MRRRGFVVLDRDGTLIRECHYLSRPDQVELLPGVIDALRRLRGAGLGLVLITNQSGVGRGYFTHEAVWDVHARLRELLHAEGIYLDGIWYCPHRPDEGCRCRKPAPELIESAAAELKFNTGRCWVVGDNLCDVELGRGVGARTLLVRTGHGEEALAAGVEADRVVADLEEAARLILEELAERRGDRRPLAVQRS